MYVEEEPDWNYRVSETSAILSSDPLGEAAEATAKGKENGMQIISSFKSLTHTWTGKFGILLHSGLNSARKF